MHIQSLNGAWQLSSPQRPSSFAATVPGCVHTDLLAAGIIEDPYYRDNELDVQWIGETDWTYRRTFSVDPAVLDHTRVLLCCNGLDTIATVVLNGQPLGATDNMYRTWEFDVKETLVVGENTLEVHFVSPVRYVTEREAQDELTPKTGINDHRINGGSWIRKQPSNFGWDWGPKLATCGIWRDIELVAFETARLDDVHILQDHTPEDRVQLTVTTTAEVAADSPLTATCEVHFDGQRVAAQQATLTNGAAELTLTVDTPQLWWPNGLGAQPLYTVVVTLASGDTVLDRWERRIGLRTLELRRQDDEWGESFYFAVNGVPFFTKGANWIPAETFVTRLTDADYARLLDDAVAANMNMVRVWGGGIYEPDVFYDLCDERGLLVWQDFMFACATYPTFDEDFMATVRVEADEAIRRLRHHASLALWCGNNELEQGWVAERWEGKAMSWEDYSRLFDHLLAERVAELDPQTPYWPSSPHTPRGDRYDWNDPTSGDAHLWQVWHGRQPFEFYRTSTHRFVSEFGFQSFPEPRTTFSYTAPQDRNITSFIMEHHQRSKIGNSTIVHYMTDWFRLPTSFESTLWLSQIQQGMAIKYAVEHWRRSMPRTMGAIYWQLNDCWPVASWASVDYYGRWKALHYMARHFYAPVLVSGVEDLERGTVEIHLTNDTLQAQTGVVRWALLDADGNEHDGGSLDVEVAPQSTQRVDTLELLAHLGGANMRDRLVWLAFEQAGEVVSTNLVLFARPKHIDLLEPDIDATLTQSDSGYKVRLEARRPALWAWLTFGDHDVRLSDNFVHLMPGRPVEITVTPADSAVSADALRAALAVQSLLSTY